MIDLITQIPTAPPGLELETTLAISENGVILAYSNAGLVLLQPGVASIAAPAAGPITTNEPVAVGTPVTLSASFTDADAAATHTATWSWGDGSVAQAGTVAENNGSGSVTGRPHLQRGRRLCRHAQAHRQHRALCRGPA